MKNKKKWIDLDLFFQKVEDAKWYHNADREMVEDLILSIPSDKVFTIKQGAWIPVEKYPEFIDLPILCFECSVCHQSNYQMEGLNQNQPDEKYCPKCGVKMNSEGKEKKYGDREWIWKQLEYAEWEYDQDLTIVEDLFLSLPVEDVAPVGHGKWIPVHHKKRDKEGCALLEEYECSICHSRIYVGKEKSLILV